MVGSPGGQVPAGVDLGGVLHRVLVIGDAQRLPVDVGTAEGNEGLLGSEQAGVDRGPLGAAGLVVEVDLADLTPLAAGAVDGGDADDAVQFLCAGHSYSS